MGFGVFCVMGNTTLVFAQQAEALFQTISDTALKDSRWKIFVDEFGDFFGSTHSDGTAENLYMSIAAYQLSNVPVDQQNAKDVVRLFIDELFSQGLIHYPSSRLVAKVTSISQDPHSSVQWVTVLLQLQSYNGIPVEGNNLIVSTFDISNQRMVDFANLTKPLALEPASKPITPQTAMKIAQLYLPSERLRLRAEIPTLVYFCGKEVCQRAYKIRSDIDFTKVNSLRKSIDECDQAPLIYIDLKGNLLDMRETIYCAEISGWVMGDIYHNPRFLDFSRKEGQINEPFSDLKIKIWLNEKESSEVLTDEFGQFSLRDVPSVQAVEAVMSGSRMSVSNYDDQILTRYFQQVNNGAFVQWNWGYEDPTVDYDPSYQEEESNVYYHVNRIYSYFETLVGEGQNLESLSAIVNHPFSCDASYDPSIHTMRFFQAGTETVDPGDQFTCDSTALSPDVIYHEFGHFIVSSLVFPFNGLRDMNNGIPDYWAATVTDDPCIAEHFWMRTDRNGNQELIDCRRRLDSDIRFSQVAELGGHNKGVVLASLLWDIRQVLGPELTDALVVNALRLQPNSYIDFVHKLLLADDKDGNLNNRTPHMETICKKASFRELVPISCQDILNPLHFLRGDANDDGEVAISDAIFLLQFLFLGGPSPQCQDAADINDDGRLDISDAIFTLEFLFLPQGRIIPAPFPLPGPDPTADGLACKE